MRFGMHIVYTKKSKTICICAGKLPYGLQNDLSADPVPLRSSAGASLALEVTLRAALGLVVSNFRFIPVLQAFFHKIKFCSGPVPVVFHS